MLGHGNSLLMQTDQIIESIKDAAAGNLTAKPQGWTGAGLTVGL